MIDKSLYEDWDRKQAGQVEQQPVEQDTPQPPGPVDRPVAQPLAPLLGAEARASLDCAVPVSYVHELAKRLVQAERDIREVAEMASQACATSSRNYSDLTNLQEGKALRDSSALLMATHLDVAQLKHRIEEFEKNLHALAAATMPPAVQRDACADDLADLDEVAEPPAGTPEHKQWQLWRDVRAMKIAEPFPISKQRRQEFVAAESASGGLSPAQLAMLNKWADGGLVLGDPPGHANNFRTIVAPTLTGGLPKAPVKEYIEGWLKKHAPDLEPAKEEQKSPDPGGPPR
jgi:hypothetical protein